MVEQVNKKMFKVRLPGDHLYGNWLFTFLSLVMPLVVSCFCCPFSHEMSWMRSGTELSKFRYFSKFFFLSDVGGGDGV